MAGDPHPHTKSRGLKYVLRRRGRTKKPRANSGDKIQLYAWHARSQFTPSGAASVQWFGLIVACLLGAMAVAYLTLVLVMTLNAIFSGYLSSGYLDIMELIAAVMILLLPFWLTALLGWIYVRLDGDNKASRKRLSDAADKLLAKRAAAQDAGANHAR